MFSYITTPKLVKKSKIKGNGWSFSAGDYRLLFESNKNTIKLNKILKSKAKTGREIGSKSYMIKSKYRFLKTANISNNFCLDESSVEYCKPENKVFVQKGNILVVKDGGKKGLGKICIYNQDNENNLDSVSAGIITLDVKDELRFYVLGILKTQHFRDFIDLYTPQGSIIRHSKLVALEYATPFPTIYNNKKPKEIERLVSILVQNIIDKEEQIKAKNSEIDKLIETELLLNQVKSNFVYEYPKISEIKQEQRFDTSIYEREFKEIDFLIRHYKNSFFRIPPYKIKTGQTPKDYHYLKSKEDKKVFLWITPRNLKHNTLNKRSWIYTGNSSSLKDGDIIFGSRGTVGDVLFYDKKILGKSYINQSTSGIDIEGARSKKIFVLSYFSSSIFKKVLSKYVYDGTVPAITPDILARFLIPNFSEKKQQKIAKKYYNRVNKNQNLSLNNYLKKEKARNRELGIFQLNMENFALREKLENIVHKIIVEKKINIEL